jgi:hypothetical protein
MNMKKTIKPLFLAMSLAAVAGTAQAAPRLQLESPMANDIESGIANVIGWSTDDQNGVAITSVSMSIDGNAEKELAYGADRPDVERNFPDDDDARSSGYAYTINTKNLSNGTHTVTITSTNELGETKTVTNDFHVSNPPKGTASAWYDEVDLSGATARVSGQRIFLDGVTINGQTYDNVDLTFDKRTSGFQLSNWVDDQDKDGYHDDDQDKDGYHDNDEDRDGYHDDDHDQDGFSDNDNNDDHNGNDDNDNDNDNDNDGDGHG